MQAAQAMYKSLRLKLRQKPSEERTALDLGSSHGGSAGPDYDLIFGSWRMNQEHGTDFSRCRVRIQDLPPELLAEIFYAYIWLVHRVRLLGNSPPKPYAWIVIRHVCRAWRAVALTFPKLSSYIHVSTLECVQDMLYRSGTAPLYVSDVSKDFSGSRIEAQQEVFRHLERIVYAIAASPPCDGRSHAPHERTKISALRTLVLREPQSSLWPEFAFPYLQMFVGSAHQPRLLHEILPSTLRHLTLIGGFSRYPLDALLALLHGLPQLRELCLKQLSYIDQSEAKDLPGQLHVPDKVTLPRLVWLYIHGRGYENGHDLLRRLSYPASATVQQTYLHTDRDPLDLSPDVFLAKFMSSNSVPPQSLTIYAAEAQTIELYLWTERLPLEVLRSEARRGASARFAFSMSTAPAAFLAALLHKLPLTGVRAAHLQEGPGPIHLPWAGVLSRLSSLEELSVECGALRSAERHRADDAASPCAGDGAVFSALATAVVHHAAVEGSSPNGYAEDSPPSALRVLAHNLCARPETLTNGRSVAVQTVSPPGA